MQGGGTTPPPDQTTSSMRPIRPCGSRIFIAEPESLTADTHVAAWTFHGRGGLAREQTLGRPVFRTAALVWPSAGPFSTREHAWTLRPRTGGSLPNRRGRLGGVHEGPESGPRQRQAKM